MSKERWPTIATAVDHYYEEGYEVAERAERSVDMALGEGAMAPHVVIWKSRHDGNVYSEEY